MDPRATDRFAQHKNANLKSNCRRLPSDLGLGFRVYFHENSRFAIRSNSVISFPKFCILLSPLAHVSTKIYKILSPFCLMVRGLMRLDHPSCRTGFQYPYQSNIHVHAHTVLITQGLHGMSYHPKGLTIQPLANKRKESKSSRSDWEITA